jgi:hypothetical protein
VKASDKVTVLNVPEFIPSFVIFYNLHETVRVSKTGNFVHFWRYLPSGMWLHIVGQKLCLWCLYISTKLHTFTPEACNILIFQFFIFRSLNGWTHCRVGSTFNYLNIILNQAELQWLFILLSLLLFLEAIVTSIYFLMSLYFMSIIV